MKNFIFSFAFILAMNNLWGQSVSILPNTISTKQDEFNSHTISLESNSSPNIIGTRFGGSLATPTAISSTNSLLALYSKGYNGSAVSGITGFINFSSTELFTPTGNGTSMIFGTTANGTTVAFERMRITHDGKVGIGTSTVTANEKLEVNGRMRLRRGSFASGLWLNNSTNDTNITDGAFIGMNNETAGSETAGFWLGGAFRWYVDRVGNTTQNAATISSLAGSGVRNVSADANGTLTTAVQTHYVSLPPASFLEATSTTITRLITDETYYFSDNNTHTLYATILLPQGSTLTNVKINYLDQSAQTSTFSLIISPLNGSISTTIPLGTTVNAISGSAITAVNQTIDNSTSGYSLKISLVADNGNMRLNGVILTYTK